MKQRKFNTIIASSRSCKAGSASNTKVLCAHILPVLTQSITRDLQQYSHKNRKETYLKQYRHFFIDGGLLSDCPETINDIMSLYNVGIEEVKLNRFQMKSEYASVLGPLQMLDFTYAISKAKNNKQC